MNSKLKTRLLSYLQNGGTKEEKSSLIKELCEELDYVDIPCMCICIDDVISIFGEEVQDTIDLQKTAIKMSEYYMEDFSAVFQENIVYKH